MKKNTYSGIQTTAIHAGEGPDPATNASAPPLHTAHPHIHCTPHRGSYISPAW